MAHGECPEHYFLFSEYFLSSEPRLTILVIQALKMFSCRKEYFDKLVEISTVSLAKDGGSDEGFSLSSAIVNFIFQKDGIQNARNTYKRYIIITHKN